MKKKIIAMLVSGIFFTCAGMLSASALSSEAVVNETVTTTNEELFEGDELFDISLAEASFDSEYDLVYDGNAKTPALTLMYEDRELEQDVDYTAFYRNNVIAGQATVVITGINDFEGEYLAHFTVLQKIVENPTVAAIADVTYTGKACTPAPATVSDGPKTLLRGRDYNLSYENNVHTGRASVKVKLIGNYLGSKTISFNIVVGNITNLVAKTVSSNTISLSWNAVGNTEYRVYRYNPASGKNTLIAKTSNTSYTDSTRVQCTKYKYLVRACCDDDFGAVTTTYGYTKPSKPSLTLTTKNKSVVVKVAKNTKLSGFQTFRKKLGTDVDFRNIKTIYNGSSTGFTNTKLSNSAEYKYRIRSFWKVDGKTIFSDYSTVKSSADYDARLRAATISTRKGFKTKYTQGRSTLTYQYNLTAKDKIILKAFADKHFTSGMSRIDKVVYTQKWINKNVKYARGTEWAFVANKSWVECIFTYKMGQCNAYNGSLMAMMAYLGYDCGLVEGYRGNYPSNIWQHYWGEVYIDGMTYVMETGNYGDDGDWMHICRAYGEASGYIKNRKNMTS